MTRIGPVLRRHPWRLAAAIALVGVAAIHLAGLSQSPPGLYNDEASIGYNAWTIAHHGTDEYGARLPLYFQAFGEYKNPVYVYLLAPLTWFLPLTAAVERLPAALCGIAVCGLLALTARRLLGSAAVALATLLTAAATPWLFTDSRFGVEVITMELAVAVLLWCLAHAWSGPRSHPGWAFGAGLALGFTALTYSSGRLLAALLTVAVLASRPPQLLGRLRSALLLGPVAVTGAILLGYARANPGQLTGRLSLLSVTADHPDLLHLVARVVRNYATYLGTPFLFTSGDHNLRHNSGYGGMLLVVVLPALLLGAVVCARRLAEPMPRLALAGALLGPVPAALTAESTPHSLRAAGMLPFLLLLIAYGWARLLPLLTARRALLTAAGLAVAVDSGGFLYDWFVRYPDRALRAWDAGEVPAVERALTLAQGGHVYMATNLDGADVAVLFAVRPDPAEVIRQPGDDDLGPITAGAVSTGSPVDIVAASRPGDVLLMAPGDPPPAGATSLFDESVVAAPQSGDIDFFATDGQPIVLVRAYRR